MAAAGRRKGNGRLRSRGELLAEEFYRWFPLEPVKEPRPARPAGDEKELSLASGITDRAVLRLLADLDVSSSVVAAVALVPLVEVAWADGELAPEERASVLRASEDQGIRPGSRAHALLSSWLEHRPSRDLFEAWQSYIEAVLEPLVEDERDRLCRDLVGRAREVARAAGHGGGPGSISAEEERALERVEAALRSAARGT
jgi:hypothetical protein